MSTLVTADLHLSENPRDAYRLAWFDHLPTLAQELRASRVLVLGDLTEMKSGHGPALVNHVVDGFAALAEVADVYVLKGNHDYLAEDVPFFRYLKHLPRVRWINEPTRVKLRGLGDCLFLPYTKNLEDWVDLMFENFDWFFCHQTFKDADLGHHKAAGSAPPFTRNARVVSGDVHVPQKLGPVTYVGAPYLVDFGDDWEPRVLLLDGVSSKSVPTTGGKKVLVKLSGKNPLAALTDLKHPLMSGLPGVRPGDVVKVIVELPTGSDLTRAAVRAEVGAWAAGAGVDLYATQVTGEAGPARPARSRTNEQQTDEAMVRVYAKKMGKGKATVAAGLKIIEGTT